jgi:hypothetical protein
MWLASCQPTTRREWASMTKAKKKALPAAEVGQVGDPQPVGPVNREVALHQIGPALRLRVGAGGPPRPATELGADDPVRAHEPLNAAARDRLAGAHECLPHPPVAVGVVVGRVELADALEQPLVLDGSGTTLAAGALEVGGRRHAQNPADRLDPEALAIGVDERAHFGRSGSSSLAKNTDADFRISFARRSS